MSIYRMTKAEQREFERLAAEVSKQTSASENRDIWVADLLAFLGIIHNTPAGKREWIGWARK